MCKKPPNRLTARLHHLHSRHRERAVLSGACVFAILTGAWRCLTVILMTTNVDPDGLSVAPLGAQGERPGRLVTSLTPTLCFESKDPCPASPGPHSPQLLVVLGTRPTTRQGPQPRPRGLALTSHHLIAVCGQRPVPMATLPAVTPDAALPLSMPPNTAHHVGLPVSLSWMHVSASAGREPQLC